MSTTPTTTPATPIISATSTIPSPPPQNPKLLTSPKRTPQMVITLEMKPVPPQGFLGLPREIRDLIYRFTLLEVPLWDKRHRPTCSNKPRECTMWEHPLFAKWKYPSCDCSKRRGLGLLCANRQLHDEAAPIFWSGNVHCFTEANDFLTDVGEVLREDYRRLLRHVSILVVDGCEIYTKLELWPVLSQCSGLESVEVDIQHVRSGNFRANNLLLGLMEDARKAKRTSRKSLKPELLNLKSFSLARLKQFEMHNPRKPDPWDRNVLYIKAAQLIDMDKLEDHDSCREIVRNFETNFLVHVNHAILNDVIEHTFKPNRTRSCGWGHDLRIPLDDLHPTLNIELRDKTKTTLQIYGTPISPKTRLLGAKERLFIESQLKAAGKLTPAEERARENVKAARETRKDRHRSLEEHQMRVWLSEKMHRRSKERHNMSAEIAELRAQEVAEKEREIIQAKELRKQERKRAGAKKEAGPANTRTS